MRKRCSIPCLRVRGENEEGENTLFGQFYILSMIKRWKSKGEDTVFGKFRVNMSGVEKKGKGERFILKLRLKAEK